MVYYFHRLCPVLRVSSHPVRVSSLRFLLFPFNLSPFAPFSRKKKSKKYMTSRKKAVSIGESHKIHQLASPAVKSIGSFIYNATNNSSIGEGVNSSGSNNSFNQSYNAGESDGQTFSAPAAAAEAEQPSSTLLFPIAAAEGGNHHDGQKQRQRSQSVMTLSHFEQMDAFASESVENLKLVLPDIFDRIHDMLTSYPEMHNEVWMALSRLLQEQAKRTMLTGKDLVIPEPPLAEKRPISFTNCHGEVIADDFAYFTDKEDASVLAYIQAERQYSDKALEHTDVLQKVLYQEFVSRIDENEAGPATTLPDGFTYYTKRIEGEEYLLHCRTDRDGKELVYLDENELYRGFDCPTFFNIGFVHHSPDLSIICYGVDLTGNEHYSVYFKDIERDTVLNPQKPISDVSESGCHFSNDAKYAFYLVLDETERAWNLKRHELGTSVADDVSLIEELDEMFFLTLTRSANGRFLFVNGSAQITSQSWYIYCDYPLDPPRVVFERAKHVNYIVKTHGNHLYMLTNQGVKNNYIFRVPIPDRLSHEPVSLAEAEIIVEHRDFVLIESFQMRARHLIVLERSNCLQNVRIMELNAVTGAFESYHYVSFSDLVYSVWLGTIADEVWDISKQSMFETNTLRFTYSSFIQPKQVIDYNMDTRTATIVYEQSVGAAASGASTTGAGSGGAVDDADSGYSPDRYVQKRLFATGTDGTAVPISLVYRKDLLKKDHFDQGNPCLLYSYGAYGVCVSPIFNANRLSLLDRGFIYALAHVRGGSDMGNAWYLEGKLDKKPNTFDDFISCAEFLVKEGYTTTEKLAIYGRSAGGLLIGAVVNKRPDLFKAVLTEVPFVDVINTMFDASIPWVAFEYEEWGNPVDKKIYNVMKTYCPYSNVSQKVYPNMLVIAGMNDPRVAYFEPAKWVAKLRHNILLNKGGRSDNMLILRVEDGGHGGSSGQYSHLEELAYEYAFLISCLKAPFKPFAGTGVNLYKKIERDEYARNYLSLSPPMNMQSPIQNYAVSPNRKANDAKGGNNSDKNSKDTRGKYRKNQSQLYQWITNFF